VSSRTGSVGPLAPVVRRKVAITT